jgi:hypothetical protein
MSKLNLHEHQPIDILIVVFHVFFRVSALRSKIVVFSQVLEPAGGIKKLWKGQVFGVK